MKPSSSCGFEGGEFERLLLSRQQIELYVKLSNLNLLMCNTQASTLVKIIKEEEEKKHNTFHPKKKNTETAN